MDFRYDKKYYLQMKWQVPVIIFIYSVICYVIGILDGKNIADVFRWIVITDIVIIISLLPLYFWYKDKSNNLTITITEEGIHFKERAKEKKIEWKNILKAEWYPGGRGSSSGIMIKTKNQKVKLPIEIGNFKTMVKMLKIYLGDKLNTKGIPLKYKEFPC